jgi:hypothetical protein
MTARFNRTWHACYVATVGSTRKLLRVEDIGERSRSPDATHSVIDTEQVHLQGDAVHVDQDRTRTVDVSAHRAGRPATVA